MPRKYRRRRRLTGGYITHLSFVDRGANQARPVLKAEDGGGIEITAKAASFDQKEGLLYCLVYGPEESGFIDAHGDSAPAAVVKHFAHNFFRPGGGKVDEQHSLREIEGAHVAESLIVQAGDTRFDTTDYDGKPIDPTGWWGVVMKIEDPKLQERCENGEIDGISMYGAEVWMRDLAKQEFTDALAERLGDHLNKEFDMDEKTLARLFGEALAPVTKALEELKNKKAEVEKAQGPETKAPVIKFEGDANKPEDVAAHKDKVFKASCDFSTLEGVEKWEKYLAAKQAPVADKPEEVSDELKKALADKEAAEKKVAELRKASTQKGADVANTNESAEARKARIMKAAAETADKHNKELGRK